nr:unnamed protein product [Digitaria exilis]
MANGSRYVGWCCAFACALALATVDGLLVDITYVESAVAEGAVCLDGSAPAYHLARGFGSGVNSWLVHFEVRYCDGSSFTGDVEEVDPNR